MRQAAAALPLMFYATGLCPAAAPRIFSSVVTFDLKIYQSTSIIIDQRIKAGEYDIPKPPSDDTLTSSKSIRIKPLPPFSLRYRNPLAPLSFPSPTHRTSVFQTINESVIHRLSFATRSRLLCSAGIASRFGIT